MTAASPARQRVGSYPIADAARLAQLPTRTVRRWIRGYDYNHQGRVRHSRPIPYLAGDLAHMLDFEQLLTLLLVKAFNRRGLGLPTIKRAAERAQVVYGFENPFVTKQFRSDGNRVFVDLDPAGPRKERELIDILSDQRTFRSVVEPSLFEDVIFVGDRAGAWKPLGRDHAVILDPARQFGAPHVEGTGVRTDVVAQMVAAEGGGDPGIEAAAEWFGLTVPQAKDAVDFEGRLLGEGGG